MRAKNIKIVKEIGENLHDLRKELLDVIPKRKKLIKVGFIKIKTFILEGVSKKMKRQAADWEKIFANHVTDNELVSRMYKELL